MTSLGLIYCYILLLVASLLLLVRHLLLEAMHLFLVAMHLLLVASLLLTYCHASGFILQLGPRFGEFSDSPRRDRDIWRARDATDAI